MKNAKNMSVLPVFFHTFTSAKTRSIAFSYLRTVCKDFFFLQFSVKFGFKKISIINVDHPLDLKIPFTPDKVSVYLDFVAFWLRPLEYIRRRFGLEASLKYTAELVSIIERCYRDASSVYRFRMTTTRRPKYYRGNFLTIHLFDPHYMCVPSLHVIIVVLAYTFYRRVFAELNMPKDEAEKLNEEMYEGAIAITETVLYIKQHSVNCIPAALYVMTRITPNEVTPTEVVDFVNHLFMHEKNIPSADIEEIRTHILDLYEQLFLEGCHDSNWTTPLQRWLEAYPQGKKQC